MSDYPARPSLFALRYVRFLMESGAVVEIGPDAFALLVGIVFTEDDTRYSRPVAFYNEQLCRRVGIGSIPAMLRARDRAVDAGFLVYIPGAKRRPGSYFVSGFGNDSLQNPELCVRESGMNPVTTTPIPIPIPISHSVVRVRKKSKDKKPDSPIGFEAWFAIYPRRTALGSAEKAFPRAIAEIKKTNKVDSDTAFALLMRWTRERLPALEATEIRFRPHPATWLNSARYRDELAVSSSLDDEYEDFSSSRRKDAP